MAKPKKTAKRNAALSIRVDEKTKYGLELMSRMQRRSVTGVVEWAVAKAFADCLIKLDNGLEEPLDSALEGLWSINELERLILLATNARWLLSYDEERMFEVLARTNDLWIFTKGGQRRFNFEYVLPMWDKLRPIAAVAAERSTITGLTNEELEQLGIIPF